MSETTKAPLGLAQADRTAVALCSSWALLAIISFVAFGMLPVAVRSLWFPTVVGLLKVGAFLISAALCWRNAQDDSILSGQEVWQAIAVGMAFHAFGDTTVLLWRSLWGLTSVASLGVVFYAASYIFLSIGLLNAVLPRQIDLSTLQSVGIAVTGLAGILLACWLNFYPFDAISSTPTATARLKAKGATVSSLDSAANSTAPEIVSEIAPEIVQLIDERLSGVSNKVGLLYGIGDCVLLVMAAVLFVAFWDGTYSEAWKLIALAALCLYVADMFLIYEVRRGSYTQGAPWELFWILSALFFGLGAGVERGISVKMLRNRSRQRWL